MTYTIQAPTHIDTTINLPASKSISNRALIIHALSKGTSLPRNLSNCDDTNVMTAALRDMPDVIDIHAAGTAMRFLTAYLSVTPGTHTLTGTERMKQRPIAPLAEALQGLGARIEYLGEPGFPPIRISGQPLEGGQVAMPGNISSQFISALLMIGPVMKRGLHLELQGTIVSRPYIDLTLHIMHEFGAKAEWTDVNAIDVKPEPYSETPYIIENDWSAASYWYATLALLSDRESRIVLPGLHDASRQGDSVVKYLFSLLGVKTQFITTSDGHSAVRITRHLRTLPRLDYDFINSPDLAQTFVTCCCALNIPFHFTGLASLKIKETNRIRALEQELLKLGYVVTDANDSELMWNGERCEASMQPIDTYEDHRMAMAFAPLAIKFPGLQINNTQVVSKSYPGYWDDLRHAGFTLKEVQP